MFSARFLLQWVLSERAGRSLLPAHFWYFSLAGSVLLLAYAIHRRDPVIMAGQIVGLAIYLRNIRFVCLELMRDFWTLFGFVGQLIFAGRFVVQWWAIERARRSLMPKAFWYLSIFGSMMLLVYAIMVRDPVIIMGRALGLVVDIRNLMVQNRSGSTHATLSAT